MDTSGSNTGMEQPTEVRRLEDVLNETLPEDGQTMDHLFVLGWTHHQSYQQAHQQEDLDSAIKYYKSGLKEGSADQENYGQLLKHFLAALSTRYGLLGRMQDLEEIISCNKQAAEGYPINHPDRSGFLNNLGVAFKIRFQKLGEIDDLETALKYHEQALGLRPSGHLDRPVSLNNLASTLTTKYLQLGQMEDLERAITCHEEALTFRPPGHPGLPASLSNLAAALHTRYQQLGSITDLGKAITYHEQALNLRPPGHLDRPISLDNLAGVFRARYEILGNMKDLEKAIECAEQALELHPPSHPGRSMSLQNGANDLFTRYNQLGQVEDLEKAVSYYKDALNLCPPGNSERSMSLNGLANALSTRYTRLGQMKDLDNAIHCHEEALSLNPPGHPKRSSSLHGLATCLSTRYQDLGEMEDLEKTVKCNEEALELHLPGHPDRFRSLNNLANTLSTRHDHLGEVKDLETAINYYEQALDLCPPSHTGRPMSLDNLATALLARHQQILEMDDLEKAIDCHEQALDLHPLGHPDRPRSLNGLASAILVRYKHLGERKYLDQVITYQSQALEICPPGHLYRPVYLYNLGNALTTRFTQFGEIQDLDDAITSYKASLSHLQPYHPYGSLVLTAQASLLITVHGTMWVSCENCSHVDEACILFKSAVDHGTSSLHDRFQAAKQWANIAHSYKHISSIHAYSLALDLQHQHLALLASLMSQQKLMENSAPLSLNAASCAINAGEPEMAVQFLEQGRSILWSKIQGYRKPLDELSEKNPQLANDFRVVAHQLEQNAVSVDVDVSFQRSLSEKWRTLLGEIRQLDGFSNFLQAVPFATLQHAAKEGPVIMVNVSQFQSDALILLPSGPPFVVALHDTSSEMFKQLLQELLEITNGTRPPKDVVSLLQYLWEAVAHPVVKQLAKLGVTEKSRIWWCPTSHLCALPIHAAGPYKEKSHNLPYLYTSSYTPTLTSLIRARSTTTQSQDPSILLVSQPDDIANVAEEVAVVEQFKKNTSSCSGQNAHKKAVLKGLQSHSWVHFACHGHLEKQPFNSWFQLHNGEPLTILDLTKAHLPNAEFAFLSACHSAAGDIYGTPDESIHLAAALQFCGFKGVIGTLWAMADVDGPALAHAFYSHMFRNGENVNFKDAAEALNLATRKLKKQGVTLDRRINFIHIGA